MDSESETRRWCSCVCVVFRAPTVLFQSLKKLLMQKCPKSIEIQTLYWNAREHAHAHAQTSVSEAVQFSQCTQPARRRHGSACSVQQLCAAQLCGPESVCCSRGSNARSRIHIPHPTGLGLPHPSTLRFAGGWNGWSLDGGGRVLQEEDRRCSRSHSRKEETQRIGPAAW